MQDLRRAFWAPVVCVVISCGGATPRDQHLGPAAGAGAAGTSAAGASAAGATGGASGPGGGGGFDFGGQAIASDTTGMDLVLAEVPYYGDGGGDIWTSTDGGRTWTDRTPSGPAHRHYWQSVASDSSGKNLVAVIKPVHPIDRPPAVQDSGDIWTSTDGGLTWTDQTPSGAAHDQSWTSVASDATGMNLVAASQGSVATGSAIWTSTDRGLTWTNRTAGVPDTAQEYWRCVTSDSTGKKLVAAALDVWTSTNGGLTWSNRTASSPAHVGRFSASGQPWAGVASDSTGDHLVAVVGDGEPGDIWTSSDAGVTWTDQTASELPKNQLWLAVACDSTGMNLVATRYLGPDSDIWTSTNGGMTWTEQADGPVWRAVASSSTGTRFFAVGDGAFWTK
jgi:hypothetical protein